MDKAFVENNDVVQKMMKSVHKCYFLTEHPSCPLKGKKWQSPIRGG